MNMKPLWLGGLLILAGLHNPAWALVSISPIPTGTLTFVSPAGNVGPTDSIPVMVTLTLDADSAPFEGDINPDNYGDFAGELPDGFSVSSAYVSYSFTHGGTFSTNGISGPPYDFSFGQGPKLSNVTLQAGESISFEFGSYAPSDGPVAPGSYVDSQLSILYVFYDESQPDPNAGPGAENGWSSYLTLASTCNGCFQRTVVAAVPEPQTYGMLLAGLGLMGWIVRRRTRA